MPESKAPYKRGYKQTKSRGQDQTVRCEACSKKFPRHKAFIGKKGFHITDPVLNKMVDKEQLNLFKRKVYYCPKCAKFYGIVEPSGGSVGIRTKSYPSHRKRKRPSAGIITALYVPETFCKEQKYTIGVGVRNTSKRGSRFVVIPKTLLPGLKITPNEKDIYLKPGRIDATAFEIEIDMSAAETDSTPLGFNLKTRDGRSLDYKVKYVTIKPNGSQI